MPSLMMSARSSPASTTTTTTSDRRSSAPAPSPSPFKLLLALLPKLPLLIQVAVLHVLRLSESAKYLDLRSDLTISVLRSFMDTPPGPRSLARTQAMTLRDPGIKGRIWVSKVASVVPPETAVRDALLDAIAGIQAAPGSASGSGRATYGFRIPDIASVEAEWTAYRAGAAPDAPLPDIPEPDKFRAMMRECSASPTVLFFHGGAYFLCDPATHRPLVRKLAKLTGGRVYSVRYRLAPQHPFPAAVLDALVSYMTLLYPPPGALHAPVPAEDIVFGGDSAGGNLTLALLQTVLELRRQGRRIRWFGQDRDVPLPAAATVNSPWVDLVQSMPSWRDMRRWDYLPVPNAGGAALPPESFSSSPPTPSASSPSSSFSSSSFNPFSSPDIDDDDEDDALAYDNGTNRHRRRGNTSTAAATTGAAAGYNNECRWPVDPPRSLLYVDDAYALHPLVSLQFADSWHGSPPIYMCCGWECLADEVRWLASKMSRDGVPLVFEQYEAMPHVFAAVVPQRPEAGRCLRGWADFCLDAVAQAQAVASGEEGQDISFGRAGAGYDGDDESGGTERNSGGVGGGRAAEGEQRQRRGDAPIESRYRLIRARTLQEVELDVGTLTPFSDVDARNLAYESVGRKAPFSAAEVSKL